MKYPIILTIIVFSFMACSPAKKNEDFSGFYHRTDKGSVLSLTIKSTANDSITGSHSFVAYHGDRIDYCGDSTITIRLSKTKENIYDGFFTSCYQDEEKMNIRISRENGTKLKFTFLDDNHPFLPKEFYVFKEK